MRQRAGRPSEAAIVFFFFFSSRRRHTRSDRDWSSDVCSSDLLPATTESLTQTSQRLAGDLGHQRGLADGARGESAKAADQAESLRVRAELMQVDASRLVSTAERGRERVARASATLRAVGEEVRATASTVAGLSGMSERIGVFAH